MPSSAAPAGFNLFFLRSFLSLGRVWYLPTIWSNCLAGWWLGGGGDSAPLPYLFGGATCLALGGSFLKDVFDSTFDYQHRRWRPIPAGEVSRKTVAVFGCTWLVCGLAMLFLVGVPTGCAAVGLTFSMLAYDAGHRAVLFSPLVLGACRLCLYLLGASTGAEGFTGWAVWCGLGVALYSAGVKSLIPQAPGAPARRWPVFLLAAPIVLAFFMNSDQFREAALLLSLVLALWVLRSLRHAWWSLEPNPGLTVSGLVAGVVFVDWLASVDGPRELSVVFIGLFVAALLFQRARPAVTGAAS
jgi:hypothetical protein